MGWFWGSSSGDNDGGKSQDTLRDLDPSLREFLDHEAPTKYGSSNPPAAPKPRPVVAESKPSPVSSTASSSEESKPKVPKQSLFQDGRYAHLWKDYQPLEEVEAAGKSEQEKISDIIDGYKYRKAEIGRAALENCALEQWDVNECFRTGSWSARMTMCRKENRSLDRCYTMQARFLKALGYLSTYDRPPEVDEQIQMHADTLYHRMLDQEKAIEEAKKEGRPVPTFPPLLSQRPKFSPTTAAVAPKVDEQALDISELSESAQKGLRKRLEGLEGDEKLLEERAIKAEIEAGKQVKRNLDTIWDKQAEERRRRKEEGKETIADKMISTFRGQ